MDNIFEILLTSITIGIIAVLMFFAIIWMLP
jgi:hypothetical protein